MNEHEALQEDCFKVVRIGGEVKRRCGQETRACVFTAETPGTQGFARYEFKICPDFRSDILYIEQDQSCKLCSIRKISLRWKVSCKDVNS